MGVRLEEYKRSHHSSGEEVDHSHEGVQVVVDNSWEHLGVVDTAKEGQAVVRKGWEDLEEGHGFQYTGLGNHYYGDVRDGYLLILAVEIQSLWVPGNRANGWVVWHT